MPSVTAGGSEQSDGNPIIVIDNTGTSNLEMNISVNATVPACMGLKYLTTWTATPKTAAEPVGGSLNTTQNILDASFTPAETAINLYLWGNFSGCGSSDATTRILMINGTTV